jgi:hypothetical protein
MEYMNWLKCNTSLNGSLKSKDEGEAKEFVETMAQNEYMMLNDRGAKKQAGILELDTHTTLLSQSKLMNTQMESLIKTLDKLLHFSTPISRSSETSTRTQM